jgi:hypothetical protein
MSRPKRTWFLGPIHVWATGDCRVAFTTSPLYEADRPVHKYISADEARELGVALISAAKEAELYWDEHKPEAETLQEQITNADTEIP